MKLPPPPSDFANLVVTLSQMGDYHIIMGSYEGITLFADALPPIEQMQRKYESDMEDLSRLK